MVKISVVTVCYNAVATIEKTMLSVLNQTYPNVEYIIIDGGSTDGTVDIIKKYADRLAYWVSEPDKGVYDAMNKGIKVATGEWINFMNSGDIYYDENVLRSIFGENVHNDADIIYGGSLSINALGETHLWMPEKDIKYLRYYPIYRHGASFVRTMVHKENLFDLSRSDLGYALDTYCIHNLYIKGYRFKKTNTFIMTYIEDGISNHPFKSLWYNYKIATNEHFSIYAFAIYFYWFIGQLKHTVYTCLFKKKSRN